MLSSKKMLAVAIAAVGFISSANAALTNPGSWTRGDANSVYAEWDIFADESATSDYTDGTPDIGSNNLASGVVSETTGSAFNVGGNIYAFGGQIFPGIFTLSIAGNSSGPVVGDNATAYLQVSTRGTPLDAASVTLGGVTATSTTLLSSIPMTGGFGDGSEDIWLFSWSTVGVANWNFDFMATGPHLSLAAVAVDIQSVPAASEVPVPAAAWLFGTGLIGLTSVARRRKS